jgi:hypothetical protein
MRINAISRYDSIDYKLYNYYYKKINNKKSKLENIPKVSFEDILKQTNLKISSSISNAYEVVLSKIALNYMNNNLVDVKNIITYSKDLKLASSIL